MAVPVRHNLEKKGMRIQAELVTLSVDAAEAGFEGFSIEVRIAAKALREALELLYRKPVQKL